eukprot:SAG25_NODE_6667_length_539_cov_36.390909_1_plen_91_part_01
MAPRGSGGYGIQGVCDSTIHWPSEADELRLGSCVMWQATIRLWLDDFHPAVGLLTLFAAICLGLAIAVRVLLLSYNISCFGHSSSVPRHYG